MSRAVETTRRTYPTFDSLAFAVLDAFDRSVSPVTTRAADIAAYRVRLGIPHFVTPCFSRTRGGS